MAAQDRSFAIENVDAFHLGLGGHGYWEGYLSEHAGTASRFLFRPGWRTVYSRRVEAAVVRVELADGTIGWGEANAPIAPEVTCLIARNLLAPMVVRREFADPSAMWDLLYDAQRGRGHGGGYYLDAVAALDIALWDALARRADLPLAAFLCESPRAEIPVYLSGLRQASRAERIEAAGRWADGGLGGIKLFLDGDTTRGVDELAALQQAVPGIERWLIDVLWSLADVDAAAEARLAYGGLGAGWLECPLVPEDLDGHRRLHERPGAPVALGEHFHTGFESRPWLEAPALDVFQPDVGRTGISDMLRQIEIARAAGIPTTPHMGSGLDVFQAATLHMAAVCEPDLLCEYQAGLAGRLDGAVDTGWAYRDGAFRLPDRPGLGVEVDPERLEPFIVGAGS